MRARPTIDNCAGARSLLRELRALLRDYWQPNTRRGVVAKERALERASQFINSHASMKEPL